jgi:hypothetical protein
MESNWLPMPMEENVEVAKETTGGMPMKQEPVEVSS